MRNVSRDLPLLTRKSASVVIPFPADRRVGKIRRVAEVLAGQGDKHAKAYWRRTVTDAENQMRRAGLDEEKIECELRAFSNAVMAQLRFELHSDHGPDAA